MSCILHFIEWIPHSVLLADEYFPNTHFQSQGIWITVTTLDNASNSKLPELYSVYSLGCLYTTSCYMVQYRPVDTDKLRTISVANNNNNSFCDQNLNESKLRSRKSAAKSSQKQANNGAQGQERYLDHRNTELEFIVAQINSGHDLFIILSNYLNNGGDSNSATKSISTFVRRKLIRTLEIPILFLAWIWFILIYHIKQLIDYRFLSISNILTGNWFSTGYCGCCVCESKRSTSSKNVFMAPTYSSISDNFFVFQCLSEKFDMMENILISCEDFVKSWKKPSIYRQKLWIIINSSIVFIMMDAFLGLILGIIINRYSTSLLSFCTEYSTFLQSDILKTTIESFKHSPLGVKFNPLITKKIGYVLKLLLREFATAISFTSPFHGTFMKVLSCCGVLGVTVQLSLVIDLIRLLTLHIMLIHKTSAVLHQFQCKLIFSLFHLFKGQKVNILRKRLDTCEYDRTQLLFGVVFFSMVFFLFPSFAAYFYLFSLTQGLVISLQVLLLNVIVFIKDFPYYCFVISVLEPLSVTMGLRFHLVKTDIPADLNAIIYDEEIGYTDNENKEITESKMCDRFDNNNEKLISSKNAKSCGNFENHEIQKNLFFHLFSYLKATTAIPYDKINNTGENVSYDDSEIFKKDNNDLRMETNGFENENENNNNNNNNKMSHDDTDSNDITTTNGGNGLNKQTIDIDENSIYHNQSENINGLRAMHTISIKTKNGKNYTNLYENQQIEEKEKESERDEKGVLLKSAFKVQQSDKKQLAVNFHETSSLNTNNKESIKQNKRISRKTRGLGSAHINPLLIKSSTYEQTVPASRIYLLLAARPLLIWKLFSRYIEYFSYFTVKDGLLVYLFNGVVYGSPSLDVESVKRILRFKKDYQKKNNCGESSRNLTRKSFYNIQLLIFDNKKKNLRKFKKYRGVSFTSNQISNNDENSFLTNQDNDNDNDNESTDEQESVYDAESQFPLEENRNIEMHNLTEIHKNLNKTLFLLVLLTYVLSLICTAGGISVFILSVGSLPSTTSSSKLATQFILTGSKFLKLK